MIFPFPSWDVVQSVGVILDMTNSKSGVMASPKESEQKNVRKFAFFSTPPNEGFSDVSKGFQPLRWMVWLVQMTLRFPNVVG